MALQSYMYMLPNQINQSFLDLLQDEDQGPSSVKELVKTVTDKYRGFAEMEEEKER